MKTIEEKARAYDEALEKARQLCAYPTTKSFISDLQDLFPELAESEDKKILVIIKHCIESRYLYTSTIQGISLKQCFAWLEKQGQVKESFISQHENKMCKENDDSLTSEDERIRKEIINYFQCQSEEEPTRKEIHNKWIAWLENIPVTIDHEKREGFHLGYKACHEKQGEQKPTDTVEPKFHEGDFIKHNKANIICKVISVNSGSYYVENIETSGRIELFNAEQNFHLWTIQDAKDGDVLKEDSCIFILEKMKSQDTAIHHCCLFDDGDFNLSSKICFDVDSTYPATKEQRDTLLKAMADAGYTFDFEKKELKKIEPKTKENKGNIGGISPNPEWSEEDERMFNSCCAAVAAADYYTLDDKQDIENWLKSLKDRVGCEANCTTTKEWSEEDKNFIVDSWQI